MIVDKVVEPGQNNLNYRKTNRFHYYNKTLFGI